MFLQAPEHKSIRATTDLPTPTEPFHLYKLKTPKMLHRPPIYARRTFFFSLESGVREVIGCPIIMALKTLKKS